MFDFAPWACKQTEFLTSSETASRSSLSQVQHLNSSIVQRPLLRLADFVQNLVEPADSQTFTGTLEGRRPERCSHHEKCHVRWRPFPSLHAELDRPKKLTLKNPKRGAPSRDNGHSNCTLAQEYHTSSDLARLWALPDIVVSRVRDRVKCIFTPSRWRLVIAVQVQVRLKERAKDSSVIRYFQMHQFVYDHFPAELSRLT